MKTLWKRCKTAQDVRELLSRASRFGEGDFKRFSSLLQGEFSVRVVKENPKRRVLRLIFPEGQENFFLKLFRGRKFPLGLFNSYAGKEFACAKMLEKADLPVIDCIAWGKYPGGEFCISREVPSAVECRQYFFESVYGDPDLQKEFLSLLCDLICSMKKEGIFHPDFHLGNILYSREKKALFLPDPYGMKRAPSRKDYKEKICHPFLELCNFVPVEEIRKCLCRASLAKDLPEAEELLANALCAFRHRRAGEYTKLKNRILSGKSKYATTVELPGEEGVCSFRHTLWFTPPEGGLFIHPEWVAREYVSAEESEKIWVDSFLAIPLPEKKDLPLARRLLPSGKSVLYYAADRSEISHGNRTRL